MFTGLIEHTAPVLEINRQSELTSLKIQNTHFKNLIQGESIAVNGVCLTVTNFTADTFEVDIVNETMNVTNFNQLQPNQSVNLERALRLDQRLGGHLVGGHVEGTGQIITSSIDGDALVLEITVPDMLMKYMVHKGSVTIDGISLTIFEVDYERCRITLNIIPETQRQTNLSNRIVGDNVNIESDMIVRHVAHLMSFKQAGGTHV